MKATPVAQSSPMLPNTMACTLTAVPQLSGMSLQAAVGDGALVHPGAEHRADRAPELLPRVLRERLAGALLDDLACTRSRPPASRRDLRSVSSWTPRSSFLSSSSFLEIVMVDAEHDVGIHLDEAAIAVVGEALVARRLARPCTVSSLRPRLRTVSIMPGIEARAPERTETSSGLLASPKPAPTSSRPQRARPRPRPSARAGSSRCWRSSRCRPRW